MVAKWRRLVLWGVLVIALILGVAYAFRPRAVPVDLVSVERGALTVTVDEEGETRVRDVFVLSAPVAGRLHRIELDVGDEVIAGETLVAQIEPADPGFLDVRDEREARAAVQAAASALELSRAEVDEAKAELDFARSDLERARQLIRKNTISQRTFDDAERAFKTRSAELATTEARLRIREFELEQARAHLLSPVETRNLVGECVCVPITAPVGGRVLRLLRESEGVIEAGDPLVEIGEPRDLEIVADFLSSEAVRVEAEQRVIIDAWGGDEPLAGVVRRIEPYGFTKVSALGIEEQRVNIIIDFVDAPERWRRLGHGYRVEVRVVLWEGEEVLKVPLTALFRDGARWAIFAVEEGRARQQFVEVGRSNALEAEIVGGIEEGSEVLLHPSDRIADGTRVQPRG